MAILLLYRPGSKKVTNNFFQDLSTHIEAMVPYKCQLVVAGDLNINVGDPMVRTHLVYSTYWVVLSVLSGSPA